MDLIKLHLTWKKKSVGKVGWQEYEVEDDPSLPTIDTLLVRIPDDDKYPSEMEVLILYDSADAPIGEQPIAAVFIDYGQNKINCIKVVREHTGWGLKESKDWVESMPHKLTVGDYSAVTLKSLVKGLVAAGATARFCGNRDCEKCDERFRCFTNR